MPGLYCRVHRLATPNALGPMSRAPVARRSNTLTALCFFRRTLAGAATTDIQHARLQFTPAVSLKPLIPNKDLVFGQNFTDHMLSVPWSSTSGWAAPHIHPFAPIPLQPSASVFHYGMECFEGMKAYKDTHGRIRLFRPEMNMVRMNNSADRVALPQFDGGEFLKCLKEFVKVDQRWIPEEDGYSLYLRPTLIATQESLGVGPSTRALLYVIACPVGPYFPTGFKAVTLWAESQYQRAWPGGTGFAKVGGNYAATVKPQVIAQSHGCQQVLWLAGKDELVTEVGTMNFCMVWTRPDGVTEFVTPPLDGSILPGVTRDSVMKLLRDEGSLEVAERNLPFKEVLRALRENRVQEMFGVGTAAIISPIKAIKYGEQMITVPLDPSNPSSEAGPMASKLFKTITDIQYGRVEHSFSVPIET